MAQVTVKSTIDSVITSYEVDNGVNKRAIMFDNKGGGSQKTYRIKSLNLSLEDMTYKSIFKKMDTDEVNGWDGDVLGNIGVEGIIDGAWITSGKLDLKLLKVDAINQLFVREIFTETNPLNADGSVKVEFQ